MLTVERTGDFWKNKIIPRLRIAGKWFDQAGFKPGSRVTVRLLQPGIMQITVTPTAIVEPDTRLSALDDRTKR
jgi:hypothetical protein